MKKKYVIPCWAETALKCGLKKVSRLSDEHRSSITSFIEANGLSGASWRFSLMAGFCCHNDITGDDPCDCCTAWADKEDIYA